MNTGRCAHCRVSWRTKQIEGGLTTGWWECDSNCGMRFTTLPHAAAVEAEYLAAAARARGLREALEKLSKKWDSQNAHNGDEQAKSKGGYASILGHRIDVRQHCKAELDAVLAAAPEAEGATPAEGERRR